jgi:AcrR family transcriptional regulator
MMKTSATRAPEDTRRKILQAAFTEFYRAGFQGGSLNHIVDEAGTTKGALFHHFKDKNDLGYAVLEEIIQPHLKGQWFDPIAESINPIEDLKTVFRQRMKGHIESGRLAQGCPLNNLSQEMSPLDEGFRQRIAKFYDRWREGLAGLFTRGIKMGKVRKNVSPRDVAAFIVAAQAGIMGTAKNSQSPELMMQAAQGLFDYLDSLKR